MFDHTECKAVGVVCHTNPGQANEDQAGGGVAGACLRAFAAAMRADNADMMRQLEAIVMAPLAEIPSAVRPILIADLRKRHTTMPAGREISHRMQRYMERALMQARLHLMGDPGARGEFQLSARQYSDRLAIRRDLAALHLAQMDADMATLPGALEWCERLVTKFTPQEIAKPGLPLLARRVARAAEALDAEPRSNAVLMATVSFLSLESGPNMNTGERVREAIVQLYGIAEPDRTVSGMDYQFRSRKLA